VKLRLTGDEGIDLITFMFSTSLRSHAARRPANLPPVTIAAVGEKGES
jgi:hypothetical protein